MPGVPRYVCDFSKNGLSYAPQSWGRFLQLANEVLPAHTGRMESPIIRLSPSGGVMSGSATLWTWEILLRKKMIASGTSSGTQEHAYTLAREALVKYRNRESRR